MTLSAKSKLEMYQENFEDFQLCKHKQGQINIKTDRN